MAQTPSATPIPIPALAPDGKVPCLLGSEEAALDVGPVVDVLLDISIDESALVLDVSVTVEEMSWSVICAMTGLAANIPVYTKIVSLLSSEYEMLREAREVKVDPAVIIVE